MFASRPNKYQLSIILGFPSVFNQNIAMASPTEDNIKDLRHRLEEAAIKSSERGLYQSAKWYATSPLQPAISECAQLTQN